MKLQLKFFSMALLCLIFTLPSCTKEVVGPTGPPGRDGANNVTVSTVVVNFDDWITVNRPGDPDYAFLCKLLVPAITNDILTGGAVLLYYQLDGVYVALPYSIPEGNDFESIIYGYELGEVHVNFYTVGVQPPPPSLEFKIVVIEGSNKMAPEVDLSDYQAVAAYYGLMD